jgi:MFS family permease
LQTIRKSNDVSLEFNVIYQILSVDATKDESWSNLLFSQSFLYRLLICLILQISAQCPGVILFIELGKSFYLELSIHSTYLGMTLVAFSSLLGNIFGLYYIDIWGRRFLYISGAISLSLCWFGMCLCIYYGGLTENKAELYYSSYLDRFLFGSILCLYAFIYSFSYILIATIVPIEIFPIRLRAKASSINTIMQSVIMISALFIFQSYIDKDLSIVALFMTFGIISLFCGIFIYISLPETKGTTSFTLY